MESFRIVLLFSSGRKKSYLFNSFPIHPTCMLVLVLSACREDHGVDLLAKPQLRSSIERLWHCQAKSLETILHHALKNVNAEISRPTAFVAGCVEGLRVGRSGFSPPGTTSISVMFCETLSLCLIYEIFER